MNRRDAIKAAIAGVAAACGLKVDTEKFKAGLASAIALVTGFRSRRIGKGFFYTEDEGENPVLYRGMFLHGEQIHELTNHRSLPRFMDERHDGMVAVSKELWFGEDGYWHAEVHYRRKDHRPCWECGIPIAEKVCSHCGFDSGPQPDGSLLIPPRFSPVLNEMLRKA